MKFRKLEPNREQSARPEDQPVSREVSARYYNLWRASMEFWRSLAEEFRDEAFDMNPGCVQYTEAVVFLIPQQQWQLGAPEN